jgi:hypothetical protein
LRESGKKYYDEINHIIPNSFPMAFDIIMTFYDIVLGSRYENLGAPRPGFAHYQYDEDTYPFEEGSPSEKAVWAFSQGAATLLHSKGGRREMDAKPIRIGGKVKVLSKAA